MQFTTIHQKKLKCLASLNFPPKIIIILFLVFTPLTLTLSYLMSYLPTYHYHYIILCLIFLPDINIIISYLLSSHLQFSFPSLISYLSTSYYHHLVLSLIFPPDINGQSLPHGDIHSSYCCLKHMVNLYCFETQQDFDVIF